MPKPPPAEETLAEAIEQLVLERINGYGECESTAVQAAYRQFDAAAAKLKATLSPEQSASIQTFPDDYLFSASWTESMWQIGNAVPAKLTKAVGDWAERLQPCVFTAEELDQRVRDYLNDTLL